MNWDRVQSNWQELRPSVLQRWGKLTDRHLAAIESRQVRREVLMHQLKEIYGYSDADAEHEIGVWLASMRTPPA